MVIYDMGSHAIWTHKGRKT